MRYIHYVAPTGETAYTTEGQPVPKMSGVPMTRITPEQYDAKEASNAAARLEVRAAQRAVDREALGPVAAALTAQVDA